MAPAKPPRMHSIATQPFKLLLFLAVIGSADALSLDEACPQSSVYSPFKKWPHDILLVSGPTQNTACWWWADCVIGHANEVRKQQFAATSLVMGLVPLILKDIAWPERRLASVPSPLNVAVEVVVRALGIIPVVTADAMRAYLPERLSRKKLGAMTLALLMAGLSCSYGALVVMEFFSKRSSLGCPYPLFVCTWFIIGVIPAAIQTLTLRLPSFLTRKQKPTSPLPHPAQTSTTVKPSSPDRSGIRAVTKQESTLSRPSAVQGGEQQWWIQFIWAIYYAAGTLIYSSIMAITVVELVVWVVLSCVTVAASKLLAFRLCGNWK
ncbi:MAG: hypothetical protein M1812_008250 [Candelaria pacifica]|nr:MAG: hypothetical protein M1812_008250 [Candelaria pacifica]